MTGTGHELWASVVADSDDPRTCTRWVVWINYRTQPDGTITGDEPGRRLVCTPELIRSFADELLTVISYSRTSPWEIRDQGWVCWVERQVTAEQLEAWLDEVPALQDLRLLA